MSCKLARTEDDLREHVSAAAHNFTTTLAVAFPDAKRDSLDGVSATESAVFEDSSKRLLRWSTEHFRYWRTTSPRCRDGGEVGTLTKYSERAGQSRVACTAFSGRSHIWNIKCQSFVFSSKGSNGELFKSESMCPYLLPYLPEIPTSVGVSQRSLQAWRDH